MRVVCLDSFCVYVSSCSISVSLPGLGTVSVERSFDPAGAKHTSNPGSKERSLGS